MRQISSDGSGLRILILKPSSLGDVIHALPVLRLLKLHQPQSRVFWWLETSLVPLLQDDPDLAGIFAFPRKGWFKPVNWNKVRHGIHDMRFQQFDLALDLQGLARSGIAAWLSGAKTVVGLANQREGSHMYYDAITPASPPNTHAVDRYLALIKHLGVPVHDRFEWIPLRPLVAQRVREKWHPENSRWFTLLPGARWDNKRWPVENFAGLVRQLSGQYPEHRFAILGGQADEALGKGITEANPGRCLNLAGATDLHEMIEWVRLSELTITNDTGPMHIAAALRRPVVALFGPTNPNLTGPYGQRQNVLQAAQPACIPCMKGTCGYSENLACLRALTPEIVARKVISLLAK